MSPATKAMIVWCLAVAACIFFGLVCNGCGGGDARKPDVPKVIGCIESLLKIMGETPNCANRARKIEQLLMAQSECFEALTGNNAPSWMCPVDGGVE